MDFRLHQVDTGASRLPVLILLSLLALFCLGHVGSAVYDYEIAMIDLRTPAPPGPPPLPNPFRREPRVQTAQPHEDSSYCYDPNDPCRQRETNVI